MTILVAPTEPPALKALGESSSMPEQWGVDILWTANGKLCGIQRKEVEDFLSSTVGSDRLNRELAKTAPLDLAVLLIEGKLAWTRDGKLHHAYVNYDKARHRAYLWSVRQQGVWIETTDNLTDTMRLVEGLAAWAGKTRHQSLARRSKPKRDEWGRRTVKAAQIGALQQVDKVSVEMAERILERFEGRALVLNGTKDQLLTVDGVGPKRATNIWDVFGVDTVAKNVG